MIMAGAQRNGAVRMMSPGDIVTLDHRVPGSSPDAAHNSPRGIGNSCDMKYCCRLASRSASQAQAAIHVH
jgi:hypothetical protein